jgi:hypothetical protein
MQFVISSKGQDHVDLMVQAFIFFFFSLALIKFCEFPFTYTWVCLFLLLRNFCVFLQFSSVVLPTKQFLMLFISGLAQSVQSKVPDLLEFARSHPTELAAGLAEYRDQHGHNPTFERSHLFLQPMFQKLGLLQP